MRLISHNSCATYDRIYTLDVGSQAPAGNIDPSNELIILEAQSCMLDLLVKCAKANLHGVVEKDIFSDQYPVQPDLPAFSRDNGSDTITIPDLFEEGPYHVPHSLDFDALLTLIEAKPNECEDNMWELREYPGKLDKFWAKIDKLVMTRARRPWQSGLMLDTLDPAITTSRPGILQRRPAWIEPTKTAKGALIPLAEQQFELELRTQRTVAADDKPATKSGTKKRGTARPDANETIPIGSTRTPNEEEKVFTVNKRVYRVFSALFHSPFSTDRRGDILGKTSCKPWPPPDSNLKSYMGLYDGSRLGSWT
ncbi:hypothetical protein EK21DRAFT_111528 [Setomelanomma holmii]|uniref:Uncharacterized protein n=1 Tax=Setomelanomma holmii TaxID=210430 RepID=A0A9P4HC28_9PLEO|nr:hypothetical protein EK21DRAFT_111528 [Setomelanomma holmii]